MASRCLRPRSPGRRGRARLAQQVARLAVQVARQPGWCHVATHADRWCAPGAERPELAQLLADAPGRFDVVAVDDYAGYRPAATTSAASSPASAAPGCARQCSAPRSPAVSSTSPPPPRSPTGSSRRWAELAPAPHSVPAAPQRSGSASGSLALPSVWVTSPHGGAQATSIRVTRQPRSMNSPSATRLLLMVRPRARRPSR